MRIGIFFSVFILRVWCFYAQNWQVLPSFPGVERDDATGFVVGNELLVGSGLSPWWAPLSDFYAFNLTSNTWSNKASLPSGAERQYAAGFSVNGSGYVFGGYNGVSYLNDLWLLDPVANLWTFVDTLPSYGRSGCAAFSIGYTVFLMGGKSSISAANHEFWSFNTSTLQWNQEMDFPYGNLWRASSCTFNGRGFVMFGRDENNQFTKGFYSYDPLTLMWDSLAPFPSLGRSHAALFALSDGVYAGFGIDGLGSSHNDLWKYNEQTNEWVALPGIPAQGRRGGVALSTVTALHYVTGIDESNTRLQEHWVYAPNAGIETIGLGNKILMGVYDIYGNLTQKKSNQLVFERYSDGTTRKVFVVGD